MSEDGLAWEKPMPTLRKVKTADILSHLPESTRRVIHEQRSEVLRDRRLSAQMRIIW
tara:strand:+ start:68 stop:238 length:171 start_codon:yes stop_codon:yes gene_type:complete